MTPTELTATVEHVPGPVTSAGIAFVNSFDATSFFLGALVVLFGTAFALPSGLKRTLVVIGICVSTVAIVVLQVRG